MNIKDRVQRIEKLDLEPIKFKLVHGDSEPEWDVAKTDRVEVEYKRFLVLNLKNKATGRIQSVVPTKDVDKFWHTHILDTAKYAVDCQFCFGFFLHHFPYLGLRGPDDARELQDRFRESLEYYQFEFGESLMVVGQSVCTTCDTSDCAPIPSCDGEPDPKIRFRDRPTIARA